MSWDDGMPSHPECILATPPVFLGYTLDPLQNQDKAVIEDERMKNYDIIDTIIVFLFPCLVSAFNYVVFVVVPYSLYSLNNI